MRLEAAGTGRRPGAGFTLLEVLAAVAVLGLVYSMLATAAIQGLRAEGDAGRRLRASLLADQRLSEIEAQAALGQAPALGVTEDEEDEFRVELDVQPLELVVVETEAAEKARQRLERAIGAQEPDPDAPQGSFLEPVATGAPPPLRRIDLRVSWVEGESEQAVHRTTYALDGEAAAPLIEALVAAAQAAEAEAAAEARQATDDQGQTQAPPAADGQGSVVPLQGIGEGAPEGLAR